MTAAVAAPIWRVRIHELGVIPQLPKTLYFPDAADEELMDIPCYCYVLTDGVSVVLVDSGANPVLARQGGCTVVGGSDEELAAALSADGFTPDDVRYVVHTHLHYDHLSNDGLLRKAHVVVQQEELDWALSGRSGPFYVAVPDWMGVLGPRLLRVTGETELLPGLRLVPNGGHTPGHQSVIVNVAADHRACICGDIVSMLANVSAPGAVTSDLIATQAFLARASSAGWIMLPSHDPDFRAHDWFVPRGR